MKRSTSILAACLGTLALGVVADATAQDTLGGCPVATGVASTSHASASCMACHVEAGDHVKNHPVDLDYEDAQHSRVGGMALRDEQEVIARGVFLPAGKVECLTCHDPRSPWKHHLAIPAGAKVTPAVDPRDPTTYEDGPARAERAAKLYVQNGERQAVSPKPLCLACHEAD